MAPHEGGDLPAVLLLGSDRQIAVPGDLVHAYPVPAGVAFEVLSVDGVRGVPAGIDEPQSEGRCVGRGGLNQEQRIGSAGEARRGVTVHVEFVGLQELQHLGLGHARPRHRILVMVAERNGPRDLPAFHGLDHVVERLLDLQLRVAAAVDHVTVDHHEVRRLRVQGLVHQFDGAAVRLLVVLGVVELDHFEAAVRAEGEGGLGCLPPRCRVASGRCGHCESQRAKRSGGSQCGPPAQVWLVDSDGHRCLSSLRRPRFRPPVLRL